MDSIWIGGLTFNGHVSPVFLGLLPGMGIDWWMDIQGPVPCPQRPMAETWACGCPASGLSMWNTSDCCVGTCCLWTRSPSIFGYAAGHCTGFQLTRRSDVSSYRGGARLPATSYYACVWGRQDWHGGSPSDHCTRRMASIGGCHVGDSWQTMWASVGLRPVVGTTIDLKVQPPPLSEREKLLLLSCWQQWDPAGVPGSALSQWLVGVEVEHGPDGLDSPTFLNQNFDVQEAVHLYKEAHLGPLEDLFDVNGPYPEGINQLTLRITTYEYPLAALLAVYFLSATGHMPAKFPTDQWIKAVQWHGDSKVIGVVNTEAEWADAKTLLAPLENVVVEAESKQGAVVWLSAQKDPPAIPVDSLPLKLYVLTGDDIQRHLPETLHVEATGLGGRDLSYPIPWDISIRTDKEGQSVYGPSLAPLEETVIVPGILGGTETLQVSALGRSKAAHEFLVLHYFALDSAKQWDELLTNVLPAVRLPGASARRATALELFGASHIQPSHRRMPHVLWTDSMTLIWNLLMGGRMGRYTGSPDTLVLDQRVDLRGFSAGSFAGLSTLQLLWKIPNVVTKGKLGAIACPPQLLVTPPTSHALQLLHYESDQLCVWKPGHRQLDQLQIRYTYVSTEGPAYKEHFGAREHSYSHWLSLDLPAGWWDLARFLFLHPTAASSPSFTLVAQFSSGTVCGGAHWGNHALSLHGREGEGNWSPCVGN